MASGVANTLVITASVLLTSVPQNPGNGARMYQ
jgi:hypothetical protein